MKLIFNHKMFQHINQATLNDGRRISNHMMLIEKLIQLKMLYFPLAIFEYVISFLLNLPIPFYSSVVYWVITNMRGLPNFFGMYIRALYYRGKLGGMDSNVFIDQNVFFAFPQSVYLAEFSYIDKNVIVMSKTAKVGRRVHIAPRVFVSGGGDFEIQDYACIATNSNIITSTEVIKDGARCSGPMVSSYQRKVLRGKVLIKKDAFIGANVTILPNVIVAEGSVIAAGVTLTKSTDAWGIYIGEKARKFTERLPVRWPDN